MHIKDGKLNFHLIGWKDPVQDKDEIIWLWNQLVKGAYKHNPTSFWLNLKERYKPVLLHLQAYELIEFINSNLTTVQEKRRAKYLEKMKNKAELEMKAWKRDTDKYEMMKILKKMITPN